ncbi:hypothetical protein OG471_00725 [Streptomyces sp. NBC_01336]|uniref:hypothetical protein n=1 Tax=Streptomyces sp. NBC_01336 TaxID=2903829 RepID=UPI002E0FC2F8|nr:hypothetical protein OG471_00725 [Streptomyces sp. NBC_01336]
MEFEQAQIDLMNRAYHQFGKTVFAAALMERSLVNAVAQHRHAAANQLGQELAGDAWEKASRDSIDEMLRRITPHLEKVPGLKERLDTARKRRNHLAHDFCFDRASDLCAPDPTIRLIAELADDEGNFLSLSAEVQAITRGLMEEAGIDAAVADALHVSLIEEARHSL